MGSLVVSEIRPTPCQCNQSDRSKNDAPLWEKSAAIIIAAGTAGLLIVNIFLWCATKKSADAAKESSDIAKQTMHIDQRAWIGIIVGRSAMVDGQPLVMPIQITNTGKTPAFNMHGKIVINLLSENEEPDFSYVHGHPSYEVAPGGQTLLPNLPQNLQFPALPKYDTAPDKPLNHVIVNDSVRRAANSGQSYIVVHGEIFYDDVFEIHHWIKFCDYAHNIVGFREHSVANTCGPYNDVDRNK